MLRIIDNEKCSGCHACANICPKKCIAMIYDNEGFLYPQIDEQNCINCGVCEKICPIISPLEMNKEEKDIVAFGAYTNDDYIRMNSSSGGVFTEFARNVIKSGGVVFGAGFDNEFKIKHLCVNEEEQLSILRGSKYVQSEIGDAYKDAKAYLDSGKLVLFTGTPCQIGGLYSYLNKKYENLITQDIICHGVPSPLVWKEYLRYQKGMFKENEIENVKFRSKNSGWAKYSMKIDFANGVSYSKTLIEDYYMQAFLHNSCLRPSCYSCSFKNKVRQSDITLADFWGVNDAMPELFSDKGVSLVLLNSQKAKEIFDSIKNNITYSPVSLDLSLRKNPSMTKSASRTKIRNNFIKAVKKRGIEFAYKKYLRKSVLKKIIIKLKLIVSKALKR